MSSPTDAHTPSYLADAEAKNRAVERASPAPIWTFLNSAFCLWLLSSIVLSLSVYVHQQWQDYKREQKDALARQEKLEIEIAGRLSQFGKWFKSNMLNHDGYKVVYTFQDGVDRLQILQAISEFSDMPQHSSRSGAHVREVFPEFSKRNMLSLYAELSATADQIAQTDFIQRICSCAVWSGSATAESSVSEPPTEYAKKKAEFRSAMVAILDPDYLVHYGQFNHDTFVSSFEAIFFTPDIRNTRLPSTDCLEKTDDCGATPVTPTPPAGVTAEGAGVTRS
jgi:hypothetical protein